MEIAYFKREQQYSIHHYYKVFGGSGKTKHGYEEVINFLNDKPIISVEHNFIADPSGLIGTWSQYEVGIPITKSEYESAFKEATESDFEIR